MCPHLFPTKCLAGSYPYSIIDSPIWFLYCLNSPKVLGEFPGYQHAWRENPLWKGWYNHGCLWLGYVSYAMLWLCTPKTNKHVFPPKVAMFGWSKFSYTYYPNLQSPYGSTVPVLVRNKRTGSCSMPFCWAFNGVQVVEADRNSHRKSNNWLRINTEFTSTPINVHTIPTMNPRLRTIGWTQWLNNPA